MKGFMNRRKAKEQEASESQNGQPPASKSSKKGKKNAPEPKVQLDLSTALPDNDSFRTSLMMGNLTARFSMLREQDDPNTKIGKASDDSVLFPKRASRLNLFNHNPLTDIAEVSSVRSSLIKPPFAREDRAQSFGSDGYASDEGGSIMNRSKPGEGNNLFGGRQKLYRIAVGSASVKTLPDTDPSEKEATGMSGRVVYQNDVSLSMFQQIREKEREERRQREQHHRSDSSHNTEGDEIEAASSPSTAFSKLRGTNSSTTSGPSGHRTSTAATSVASEPRGSFAENRSVNSLVTSKPIAEEARPMERASTMQRKLYGQAVDQSSPTHRAVRNVLDGSTRPRAPTNERKPHALSPSKSASNLSGKYSRPGAFYPPVNFRTASPPPSVTPPGMVPMDLGLRETGTNGPPPGQAYGSLPPLSPPPSDGEDVLTYSNSVQPEDRGKATAMGLFNRPQKQYDEQQFSQRQVQMHEGRMSPLPQRQAPVRRDGNASPASRTESPEEERHSPENHSRPLQTRSRYSPVDLGVARTDFRISPRLPPNAMSSPPPSGAASFSVPPHQPKLSPNIVTRARARADSLKRHQAAEPDAMEIERKATGITDSSPPKPMVSVSNPGQNGTFLDNFSPSDDEPDAFFESPQPVSRRPPSGVHPALRDGTIDFAFEPSMPSTNKSSEANTIASDETERALWTGGMNHAISEPSPSPSEEKDDDLLDTASGGGLGLSGMIRSHLRQDSDKSSIYPPASISQASALESPRLGVSARSQNQPESIHSNPWEFDDLHARTNHAGIPDEPQDLAFTSMSQKAKQILGQATAFQAQGKSKAQQVLGDDAPLSAGDAPVGPSWQDEMRLRHQRDASTETKHEREDFANELAERRRRVQETVKSMVETNNRPESPVRLTDRPLHGPANPLATLKHKTSKSSMRARQPEHQTKAMKMLGITSGGMNETFPDVSQEDQWAEEEQRMLHDFARRKPRSPGTPLTGPLPPYSGPPRAASPRTSPYEESERLRQRSITPTTARNPRRDHAESTTSGQSRSRGPRAREDGERPMIAGTGNYSGLYDKSHKAPSIISLPRPSLDGGDQELYERSPSAMSTGRQRSNSRHTGPGYFDGQQAMQGYNGPLLAGELPPPLPIQAYSANSTPPLNSPALFIVSTPTLPSHPTSHDGGLPQSFGHRSASTLSGRKKSVTKNMISDPTLLSSTSNIPAVSLPAPPNFRPHELASPPLPIMNPRRRRQTTTHDLFAAQGNTGKVDARLPSMPESPNRPLHKFEERSTFSDEGEQRQPRQRSRLRKTSSEGGSMNLKARQQLMMASSPALPRFPPGIGYSKPPPAHALNGGMF